jgi:hypothetical protein
MSENRQVRKVMATALARAARSAAFQIVEDHWGADHVDEDVLKKLIGHTIDLQHALAELEMHVEVMKVDAVRQTLIAILANEGEGGEP